jgi:Tfp pilus assembly protein FimT
MREVAWPGRNGSQFSVLSLQFSAISHLRSAFTLVELLILVAVVGIVFGLALPMLGDAQTLRLREAARMLAADFEFAQSESVAHGDDPRLVKFDTAGNRYWVAASSAPDTPVTDPSNQQPLLTVFGSGRASGTAGVTLDDVSLGGDSVLLFDAYGGPDQAADATVRLAVQAAGGAQTLTVRVKAGSGEVSVE